jgi:hypothetical protein
MRPSDFNFVKKTFLEGLYFGNEFFNIIPKTIFFDNYKKIADQLIMNSVVSVSCSIADEDVIQGYSIVSKDLQALTWVHVKKKWRKGGIGKALLPPNLKSYNHFSTVGMALRNKLSEPLVFDPFKL